MSGGHDKASGKAIGESRRFGSGVVDMSAVDVSRLYGLGRVGGPCTSPGWAPALQIAQVPRHPAPCDTLAVQGCL